MKPILEQARGTTHCVGNVQLKARMFTFDHCAIAINEIAGGGDAESAPAERRTAAREGAP